MFPSANCFRDIPCPFFSRVSCPRPHCHFKHVQAPNTSSSNLLPPTHSSSINIPPDANETLNKLINQLSNAAGASSAMTTASASTNPLPSVDLTSLLQSTLLQSLTTVFANALNGAAPQGQALTQTNNVSEKLTQVMNGIATQISQQSSTSASKTASTTADTVPQYRPTPIAELQRLRRGQQANLPSAIKLEPTEFDSDDYMQATFSPPSTPTEQGNTVEEAKPKASTVPKATPTPASNLIPKPAPSITTDAAHSWVTPPVRRQPSASTDHDERKAVPPRKLPSTDTVVKALNKPTTSVKPTVLATSSKTPSETNPLLKRIPKKVVPSKVRLSEIDLDRVPVTSGISLDMDANQDKPVASQSTKRPSNGTSEIPQKKAKLTTAVRPPIVKKPMATSNGIDQHEMDDEDAELALFDLVFPSSKASEPSATVRKPTPIAPPNSVQQLTARYSCASSSATTLAAARTRAETSSDGRRVAHQPKVHPTPSQPSMPTPLQPLVDANSSSNKIPFKTRQEYLNFFLNELKKQAGKSNGTTPTTPVFARAQSIEKDIFDKSTNKNSYLNLAAKYVRQLRTDDTTKSEPTTPKKTSGHRLVVSHSAMLSGGQTDNGTFSIKKQTQVDLKTLTDNEIYTLLLPYKASEQDLLDNGYPAFSLDFPDKVLIKNKNPLYNTTVKMSTSDPNSRLCCRCSKNYRINQDGEYLVREDCIYHWGRMRSQRVAGQIEKTYSCCGSNSSAIGCAVSQYHVSNGDDTQLLPGYVKTRPLQKPIGKDDSYGIFALDCEMCYTVDGLELVRVSVINHKLQPVFETLVKPHHDILDYNTRWSGISEPDLRDCNVRLDDVQRRLLKLFNEKSILMGHSLESDLKALKIVHETVIDTSLVFPHGKGKPYKRALKNLATEHLSKIIQESAEGHDSMEDAITCMELMLWKVKETLRSTAAKR